MWKDFTRLLRKLLGIERSVDRALRPMTKIVRELNEIADEQQTTAVKAKSRARRLQAVAEVSETKAAEAATQAKRSAEFFGIAS